MTGADLDVEWIAAQREMTNADRADLEALGVRPGLSLFLVGISRVREMPGSIYEPDDHGGKWAYLTPVRVKYAISPESACWRQATHFGSLVDIVAWSPVNPEGWALRRGVAEWAGSVMPQYLDPPMVAVRRSILSWLRADATGLVLLTREPAAIYRLLSACQNGLITEDAEHAQYLSKVLKRPWPCPPVAIAGARNAAA
jgi:hypothetical protein